MKKGRAGKPGRPFYLGRKAIDQLVLTHAPIMAASGIIANTSGMTFFMGHPYLVGAGTSHDREKGCGGMNDQGGFGALSWDEAPSPPSEQPLDIATRQLYQGQPIKSHRRPPRLAVAK